MKVEMDPKLYGLKEEEYKSVANRKTPSITLRNCLLTWRLTFRGEATQWNSTHKHRWHVW